MSRILIIGAGISGCVMARRMADAGHVVDIYERREYEVGGNCYSYLDSETMNTVHKYGPHIFHTDSKLVYDFVTRFCNPVEYHHKVVNEAGEQIPFILSSIGSQHLIDKVRYSFGNWERVTALDLMNSRDSQISALGKYVYDRFFKYYSQKQWGEHINLEALLRVPLRINEDNRDGYFLDRYQFLPEHGYEDFMRKMLEHKDISLLTGDLQFTSLEALQPHYDVIVYTGAIDELFNYSMGALQYRTLDFVTDKYIKRNMQDNFVVNYTFSRDFTRIADYSHVSANPKGSVVVKEFVRNAGTKDEKYYVVNTVRNRNLHAKYSDLFYRHFPKGVLLGRLAEYKYLDMDDAVLGAYSNQQILQVLRERKK